MIPNNISIDEWENRFSNDYELLKQGIFTDVVPERLNARDLLELIILLHSMKQIQEERAHVAEKL